MFTGVSPSPSSRDQSCVSIELWIVVFIKKLRILSGCFLIKTAFVSLPHTRLRSLCAAAFLRNTDSTLVTQNNIKEKSVSKCLVRSRPRPISTGQLHTLLHFHLQPIYLVVFQRPYFFRMRYLILRGASCLDAFSTYPFQT